MSLHGTDADTYSPLSAFLCRFDKILFVKREIIFVTGIGTGIGKTVVSAVLTEALEADYWKPVQSGLEEKTDTELVSSLISNKETKCWEEAYRLKTPASPHLAARIDQVQISLPEFTQSFKQQDRGNTLIVEGAGGLLVPLNDKDFFPDVISLLRARVVAVSTEYLGNINHSLLTANVLRQKKLDVLGWVFSGRYHSNEDDIVKWSGFPKIGRVEKEAKIDPLIIKKYAQKIKPRLIELLNN